MALVLIATIAICYQTLFTLVDSMFAIKLNASNYDTWYRHSHWRCNAPDVNNPGMTLLSLPREDNHATSLLLFGGSFKSNRKASNLTYVYNFDSSSWSLVETDTAPKPRVKPMLITLCGNRVILFGGYQNDTKSGKQHNFYPNDTWVYDTQNRNWKSVSVSNITNLSNQFSAGKAVAIRKYGKTCKCNDAALFLSKKALWFWTLECVDDSKDRLVYNWKIWKSKSEDRPKRGRIATLVSTKSDDSIYMMDSTWKLWRLSVRTTNWSSCAIDEELKMKLRKVNFENPLAFYNEQEKDKEEYVAFSRYREQVVVYKENQPNVETSDGAWLKHARYHPKEYANALHFDSCPVVYLDHNNICWPELWRFCNESSKTWKWTKLGEPLLAPTSHYQSGWQMGNEATFQSFKLIGQHVYVFIKRLSDRWISERLSKRTVVGPQVWSLNVHTRTWWSYDVAREIKDVLVRSRWCGSVWLNNILVISVYVPDDKSLKTWADGRLKIWAYDVGRQGWTKLKEVSDEIPDASCGHTLVAVNSTNGILFGGKTDSNSTGALCDTWEFHVDSNLRSITWHRHGSRSNCNNSYSPNGTYGHSACKAGSNMIVFGGILDSEKSCSKDFWSYSLISMEWKRIGNSSTGPRLAPSVDCSCSMAATPNNLWLTVLCDSRIHPQCRDNGYQTWMYVFESRLWIPISYFQFYESKLLSNIAFLDDQVLVMFDPYDASFIRLKAGCPRGFNSPNVATSPCTVCGKSKFAGAGETHCTPCPKGLTTESATSESILNCSVCNKGYCAYGDCVVTHKTGAPSAVCVCNLGYSGRQCDQPTYILISVFVLVLVAALSIAVFKGTSIWRYKGQTELALRRDLSLMAAAWQIHRDEVAIGRRLGGGGFGDVYEAKYRGMTVAVKLLREWQDAKSSYEFQREILFMQTVRHPNIVLFIGCGSTEATREPFLVLEYMSRGTLCDILYGDNPLDFSHNQKIGFALDIARGMRFLHGLNPPRIHRDLKSANLLVGDNWVVKVSDFGLGRAVTSGQQKKTTTLLETRWSKLRWSRTPSTVTVSLLNPESELSHRHVGTARWCAPELRAGGEYHVSVDVFSFGILLWEIWCHRLPFDNYPFSSAAANAINKGERPPVPTDCSPIYTALMKLCWSHNPNDRPNFVHIVASLEALQAAPAF